MDKINARIVFQKDFGSINHRNGCIDVGYATIRLPKQYIPSNCASAPAKYEYVESWLYDVQKGILSFYQPFAEYQLGKEVIAPGQFVEPFQLKL